VSAGWRAFGYKPDARFFLESSSRFTKKIATQHGKFKRLDFYQIPS